MTTGRVDYSATKMPPGWDDSEEDVTDDSFDGSANRLNRLLQKRQDFAAAIDESKEDEELLADDTVLEQEIVKIEGEIERLEEEAEQFRADTGRTAEAIIAVSYTHLRAHET